MRHLEGLAGGLQGNELIPRLVTIGVNGVIGSNIECCGLGRLLEGGWRGGFLELETCEARETVVC